MKKITKSNVATQQAYMAVNRFGYGCKHNELADAQRDVKAWCQAQLVPISFKSNLATSNDVLVAMYEYRQANKQAKMAGKELDKKLKKQPRKIHHQLVTDTLKSAINSDFSISYRLLDFFSNHFSVSGQGRLMVGLAPTLEREAIAPHLLGEFEHMLQAVVHHPAMLVYLNNEQSFGPSSKIGKRRRGKGLNENLAREILELHTLGVDGGYKQKDVIALAKALTGWSINNTNKKSAAGFTFKTNGHEPDRQTLLGKTYPDTGVKQAEAMLTDLARHPNTAKYVCKKLIFHFVGEQTDDRMLSVLTETWRKTNGNIKQVMSALFNDHEVWIHTKPQKYKTPRDFVISTARLLGIKDNDINRFGYNALTSLGQKPLAAGSPAGYNDDNDSWLTPTAMMARADWSMMVANRYKKVNAEQLMTRGFSSYISEKTYNAVVRAESREQGLGLLLMSPEFQWR